MIAMDSVLVASLFVTLCGHLAQGHVRLVFPPARKYALDFLDNLRTPGACGMPRTDDGPVTQIAQGSEMTVKWHLGYAHDGGYKLQILDKDGNVQVNLTDDDFVATENITAQYHKVKLPADFTCAMCTLRLVRQATEWGPTYLFRSCADIAVIPANNVNVKCSGKGQYNSSTMKCTCEENYAGHYCEGKDECREDSDCGEYMYGKCVDTKATTYPKRQCYCKKGYFGEKCKKHSTIDTVYDKRYYVRKELKTGVYLYYRHLMSLQQIEIIMVANVKTYVAIGWRPKGYKAQCRSWPQIKGYKMHAPGDAGITQCGKPEPEDEPTKEPTGEPTSTKEPSGEPASTKELTSEPTSAKKPNSEPSSTKEPTSEPTNTEELTSEPTSTKEPTSEPISTKEPTSEPTSEPKSEPTAEYDRKNYDSIHGMDCTDIVIGTAYENYHRVHDYYTRDRSTPRMDTFYGGEDDLADVNGYERGGKTYIMFRKNVKATHRSDNNIECGGTHVTWAHGRAEDQKPFYRTDELKYHGHYRGKAYINFHDMSSIKHKTAIVTIKQPLSIKLTSVTWDKDFADNTTQKSKGLRKEVINAMTKFMMKKLPQSKLTVNAIRYGSVVVDMEVSVNAREYEADTFRYVTKYALKDEISDGKLGDLGVDKNFLIAPYPTIVEATPEPPTPEAEIMTWNEMYIMIGCIVICVVILIIAVIVAKIYVNRKLKEQQFEKVAFNQPKHDVMHSAAVFDPSVPTNQSAFTNKAYQPPPSNIPPQYQPYVPPTNAQTNRHSYQLNVPANPHDTK